MHVFFNSKYEIETFNTVVLIVSFMHPTIHNEKFYDGNRNSGVIFDSLLYKIQTYKNLQHIENMTAYRKTKVTVKFQNVINT
jgi:hypothetical protein